MYLAPHHVGPRASSTHEHHGRSTCSPQPSRPFQRSRYPSPGPLLNMRTVLPMTSTPVPSDQSLPRCCTPMSAPISQHLTPLLNDDKAR
ncbi:hypothetical protein HYPSUDRAFT_204400 [Hypholoma sublateritium FD-334 SS-4]|uniref:Uncharacterized protein n=1 Tax=Hypholoma sublateritium (strain FD-334 SS-4) TaxID=945553 RepID=A0A0D2PHZ1_HYPSF|nr:hypothetical protein HYPSUDRAFT_204400 [Hypholoma sublateritium FD-334 SS-4]